MATYGREPGGKTCFSAHAPETKRRMDNGPERSGAEQEALSEDADTAENGKPAVLSVGDGMFREAVFPEIW